ncbi:hypothetical protein [Pseudomonas sp. MF6751]|uniref:hypothetical protein n=1 Tax=Pseudomonas sp. MF6751 TaxID=2797528 RepID=UPI003FA37366
MANILRLTSSDCLTGTDETVTHERLLLAESSRRSRHRRGLCAEAESTKAIKRQIAESLYLAYNDAASHRANQLKS